jgi:hypothetical protein
MPSFRDYTRTLAMVRLKAPAARMMENLRSAIPRMR